MQCKIYTVPVPYRTVRTVYNIAINYIIFSKPNSLVRSDEYVPYGRGSEKREHRLHLHPWALTHSQTGNYSLTQSFYLMMMHHQHLPTNVDGTFTLTLTFTLTPSNAEWKTPHVLIHSTH
eukprot:jgi/Psemu1/304956/fgenesh1_kg.176_\